MSGAAMQFKSRDEMNQAAGWLLGCPRHAHHFDVRPDFWYGLEGLSDLALECLGEFLSGGVR